MLLPADCPYASCKTMPSDGLDTIACCRARDSVWGPVSRDDPPLCRCPGGEVYRFEWRSSFHGDATVRIARQDGEIELRWEHRGCVEEPGPGSLRLTARDWKRLTDGLARFSFWTLDPNENSGMIVLDGASWVIEGRRGHDFQVVMRRLPNRDGIGDLGQLFFALAGLPLAAVRLY